MHLLNPRDNDSYTLALRVIRAGMHADFPVLYAELCKSMQASSYVRLTICPRPAPLCYE